MEANDIQTIQCAMERALNLLWDEIDGVYDDDLRESYNEAIDMLTEAIHTIKKH